MGSSNSKKNSATNASCNGSKPRLEQLKVTRTTRTHVQCMSRASNRFAIQLYQEFARDGRRPGNLVFSPLNLSVGLGLVCLGAKSATREELIKALYLNEVQSEHRLAAYAAIHWDVTQSSTPKGCLFESIIHLLAPEGHRITTEYMETCNRYRLTPFRNVDFVKRPDMARKEINKWAQLHSNDRITDVIPTGIVDRYTKLFLLCALYLKIQWLHPFSAKCTAPATFTPSAKESLRVEMMRQRNEFRVVTSSKLDSVLLELPLANSHMKFCVLLPRRSDGLAKLESRLSRENIEAALEAMTLATVDVFLPKFRYELGLPFREPLERLGICTVFVPGQADLSDMDGTRLLHLSRIFHHVELEFGEEGADSPKKIDNKMHNDTNTATTTTTTTTTTNDLHEVRCVRADHPFLFMIIDERTSAMHVIGRVVRPLSA